MANNSFEQKILAWLSPLLISVVGFFLWDQYQEIRTDVKALVKSDAQVVTSIADHDRRITGLEGRVYSERLFAIKEDEFKVPKRQE